ncbi:MAG: hypothetical protein MJY87_00400 [Fibrobacter sp.]|nr:hypothetical protein [Fibrobacter sp.]
MIYRFQLLLFALLAFFIVACSDDTEGVEYMFDREVSELTAFRQCAKDADSGAYCFMLRFHYPIATEKLESFYLWVDSTVVGDTAKEVSKSQLEKATAVFDYSESAAGNYDTIDLTPYIQEFVKERDSLMVAVFCKYSDDKDPGSVQRTYLHFGDDIPPLFNPIARADSQWTTGAMFRWFRPTDQVDYYAPNELSGPIVGYNVIIYSEDKDEDLRDLKVTVTTSEGVDSTGGTLYERQSRIYRNNDSVWVDTVAYGDYNKNRLRLMVWDGKGYDVDDPDANVFRLTIEGLKSESHYMIGASAYDSSGNSAGNENVAPDSLSRFFTTDSIAPLMATRIFTLKDSTYPELARLDSNNRLRIFWSRSVDPKRESHGIKEDSVLVIPDGCTDVGGCYDSVESYIIDYYDAEKKDWVTYSYAGGTDRYSKLYKVSGDTMEVDPRGIFVTDTIRWVIPGDTLVLRIRSKDPSGYYSRPLVDTVVVSPGVLASKVDCPEGFVPVSTSDTNVFCMEKFEHRDDSGAFMNNVLHSEAMAACEAISASGFEVKLCGEQDWLQVCLSGGTLPYGVVEENLDEGLSATAYLFTDCNVGTNDSSFALNIANRSPRCVSPMGVRDMPGQLQEWVRGRSEDSLMVLKGGSYEKFGGLDRESQALCTTRSFPYFTRPAYTKDTVYLYREGTKVDTVFVADTSRTAYEDKPFLTQKDFKDSLQFFDVQDSSGNSVGTDYALYSEYRKGGDEWLAKLAGDMKYVPDHVEVVFLTGEKLAYRGAAAFYKSPSIGFRCCAYPK